MKLLAPRRRLGSAIALSILVAAAAPACGDDQTNAGRSSDDSGGADDEGPDGKGTEDSASGSGGKPGSTKPGAGGTGSAPSGDGGDGPDDGEAGAAGAAGASGDGGSDPGSGGSGGGEPDPDPLPCEVGTWDDDSDPASACVLHTTCGIGLEEDVAGTPTTDRTCRPTWPLQFGTSAADGVYDVAVDGNGDVVVVGWVNLAFPGFTNAGVQDAYVRKVSATGVVLWTRQFGSAQGDAAQSVAVNANNEIFVSGYTQGALDGQPGLGGADVFLRKYAASGELVWTKTFGNADTQHGAEVALASDGSIYVGGYTRQALDDQTAGSTIDAFIRKHDADGNWVWTRQFGGVGPGDASNLSAHGYALAVNTAGEVLIGGTVALALAGETGAGSSDAFVRKYTSTGSVVWSHQFGSDAIDGVHALAVDSDGDVYCAGHTWGTLAGQTSSGHIDAFVRKIDGTGLHEWTRQFGSAAREVGYGLAIDTDGKVYVAGVTEGTLPTATSVGSSDAFIAKYDSDGDLDWLRQVGTSAVDQGEAVAAYADEVVYLGGVTVGALPNQAKLGTQGDSMLFRFNADGD